MKRHEKPYGCTFDNCSKTFGSKNDWKRHESSQHWHLETWKCDCKKTDGEPCDKGFLRRESFKNHLQHNHTMTDSKQIDEKLENCRIGRHCESRFWCGFCEKLIEIGPEKVNAWTLRCNHIDDHFCGRRGEKKNITYWKPAVSPEERHEDDSVTSSDNTSTGGPSLKRKPDQPLGPQAHKRQQVQTLYMWNCVSLLDRNLEHLLMRLSVNVIRCPTSKRQVHALSVITRGARIIVRWRELNCR